MAVISNPGLKQIVECDFDTLATTPTNPIAFGIRKNAGLKRSHYKALKDYLEGQWRGMMNFNLQGETMQPTMQMLELAIERLNGNVDLQVITVPQTLGGTGDVYKFNAGNNMGTEFEVLFNSDGRTMKKTYEIALPWTVGQALVDSADSATPVTFAEITHPRGEDESKLRKPYFIAFEAPKATSILTRNELESRTYSIKTVNKKLEEPNMTSVTYLMFDLTLKFKNASVAKQIEILNKTQSPSIYMKEGNESSFYDAWDFNSGVLTLNDEYDDDDDDRALTLKFQRKVMKYDIAFLYGATYGGDATDEGAKGGTMKVGF
jgi:hypothetical protein